MEVWQIAVIAIISTLLVITLLLIGCSVAAMKQCKRDHRCKQCNRFNETLTGTCEHCGSDSIYKKVTYRSFLFGRIKSINKDGNDSWKKKNFMMKLELVTWVILVIAQISAIVLVTLQ